MSYYIGTKTQCEYYKNKVATAMGLNGSISTQHAPLIQSLENSEKYAILKHPKYTHSNMQLINQLPEEFTPNEI